MRVSEAASSRITCRAFRPDPIAEATVRSLLTAAARAPSGGNLQPWRVWALAGAPLAALTEAVCARLAAGEIGEFPTEYLIYPPAMAEPYATRKRRAGEALYRAIGVARDDGAGQMAELAANFRFFGAPVGLIFAFDRALQPGQWADLGLYMQTLMLLAREAGLHTAALESWSLWHRTVRAALAIPEELMVFCGMALGRMDEDHPANRWRTERAGLEDFAVIDGFE